jgi:hypothetical protein
MTGVQNASRPDFLIIGAQKCGTSALRASLRAYDGIVMPDRELHFFDNPDIWSQGLDWYFSHFNRPDLLQGEKTPEYLDHPDAVERIASVLPDVKLIILLRDPVTRAYSQWNQMMQTLDRSAQRGWEPVSFEQAVSRAFAGDRPYNRLLRKGTYIDQILRVANFFPRRQIHFGIQERMLRDGRVELARVLNFLGVKAPPIEPKRRHVRPYDVPIDPAVERELLHFFGPFNRRLFDYLGEDIPEWGRP